MKDQLKNLESFLNMAKLAELASISKDSFNRKLNGRRPSAFRPEAKFTEKDLQQITVALEEFKVKIDEVIVEIKK